MNQIALGDPASGWLILLGDSVSPPFIRASYQSVFSPGAQATESLEIHLEGVPPRTSCVAIRASGVL
jgi:hypothetical protein